MSAIRRVAVSGSWRHTPPALVDAVRALVDDVVAAGGVIVTGGALGTDDVAARRALERDPSGRSVLVLLPTPLPVYAAHFRARAAEGVVTPGQADGLVALLETLAALGALVEGPARVVDVASYYARNTAVLVAADELAAFCVNGSAGVQDTVDKARARGMPVALSCYET